MLPESGGWQLKTYGGDGCWRGPSLRRATRTRRWSGRGRVLAVGQEEVPQALGLRALAQLDEDLRERGVGVDLAVERLFDLRSFG